MTLRLRLQLAILTLVVFTTGTFFGIYIAARFIAPAYIQ